MQMQRISLDLDGVLTDYPNHWLGWLRSKTGLDQAEIHDISSAKRILAGDYELYKTEYRNSESKYLQPVNRNVVLVIESLKRSGYEIAFATDRPFEQFPQMFQNTRHWLQRNGLASVSLNPKSSVFFSEYRPHLHVDDQPTRIIDITREFSWINCLLISTDAIRFEQTAERIYSTNSNGLLVAITQICEKST